MSSPWLWERKRKRERHTQKLQLIAGKADAAKFIAKCHSLGDTESPNQLARLASEIKHIPLCLFNFLFGCLYKCNDILILVYLHVHRHYESILVPFALTIMSFVIFKMGGLRRERDKDLYRAHRGSGSTRLSDRKSYCRSES